MKFLQEYKDKVAMIERSLNAMYSKLTFTTVAEILEEEVDLRGLWNANHNLYMKLNNLYGDAYNELEFAFPDDDDTEGLDLVIDDIHSKATDKSDAISDLIDALEDIVNKDENYGIKKHFQDIEQINI